MVIRDQHVLLVKRSGHLDTEPGKWALPSGFLDRDETGAQGAVRECLEETGYLVESPKLGLVEDSPERRNDDRQNVALVYTAGLANPDPVQKPDGEQTQVKWFALNVLPSDEDWAFDHRQLLQTSLAHTSI